MKLSIIIPALNESEYISQTLVCLSERATDAIAKDIIVVDGGSKDDTASLAIRHGARVIYETDAPKGRAYLLNRGAEFATGDVLMFCDADCLVPQGYDAAIANALQNPQNIGGAFAFKLDGKEWGLRIVEWVNRLRYHIFPWYYGDQGVFVKKEYFKKVDGFPKQAMMSSSDLCRKLWKHGRLKLVRKPMETSARRFLENGVFRMLGRDFEIWLQDILGRDVEKYAEEYWGFNEQGSKKGHKKTC